MTWLATPYVGGLLETAQSAITWSDQQIKDLDIPIMTQALTLQDKVFAIADQAGIGPEVKTIVYGIRTYEYASVLASSVVPPAAAAAAGDVLAGVGGAAALGAAGAAAVAIISIFGGGEDYSQRQARATEYTNQISRRLDLQGFADEEDAVAKRNLTLAPGVQAGLVQGNYLDMMNAANLASKLAAFYRIADQKLSGSDKALFISLSNIGRWDAARKTLQGGVSLSDPFAAAEMPKILSKIVPQLDAERVRFAKLAQNHSESLLVPVAVTLASGAAAYYFLAPVAALSLYHGALSLGAGAVRFVWRLVPKVRI